jgi:MFS family permease
VDAADHRPVRRSPTRLLRVPNFRWLFSAGLASITGSGIGGVALTWLVLIETHSALAIAGVGLSFLAAAIVWSVFAGAVVDRGDRRRIMIGADIARAATLGVLVAWLFLVGFNLPLVFLASFVVGSFTTLFQPAERALLPDLLPASDLADANGIIQAGSSIAQFLSNAAGGILVALVGAAFALGLNSITFGLSAVCLGAIVLPRAMNSGPAGRPSAPRPTFLSDVGEGLRYLRGQAGLLMLTLSAGIENFFFAMVSPFLVLFATLTLHSGAATFGLLLGLFGLGFGGGSLLVGRFNAHRHIGMIWPTSGVVGGALIVLMVAVPVLGASLVLWFALGVTLGFSNTAWLSAVQLLVPRPMQGRYFGVDQLGSYAVIPAGQVVAAYLITDFGVNATWLFAGVGFLLTGAGFFLSKSLRRLTAPEGDAGAPFVGSPAGVVAPEPAGPREG